MAKNRNNNKNKNKNGRNDNVKIKPPLLSSWTKRWIKAILMFLVAIIIVLSFPFFNKAGYTGQIFIKVSDFLIGKTFYTIPLFLFVSGLIFLKTRKKGKDLAMFLAIFVSIIGLAGILAARDMTLMNGGWIGFLLTKLFAGLFGLLVANIIFVSIMLIGLFIFLQFIWQEIPKKEKLEGGKQSYVLNNLDQENLRIKGISSEKQNLSNGRKPAGSRITLFKKGDDGLEKKDIKKPTTANKNDYVLPPLDLLSKNEASPTSGNIKENSMIIKSTLENFGIPVEMAEVNVGPTVTQYAFKPAEGVKLSKITTLSNNLALALAAHPIRIEAPIPGKSLVGIEVPNKVRSVVTLRNLISQSAFQNAQSPLLVALGRNVSGSPVYADVTEGPHVLVAGATGTGKTCGADTLMFTEKGMLTFEELCPLPLNSEVDYKIKLVTRDGIETAEKNYNNGICQFYKLTSSRGYKIEATMEHPLWVMNEDGSQSWKPASLIRKGDYVAISRNPAMFGNRTDLSDFKPSKIVAYHRNISFPSKMTSQLAQFLGLLTADGGLSTERKGLHRIVYTQASPQSIRIYKKYLRNLFGITQFIEKKSGSNPENKAKDIEIGSKHLKEFLAYLGMDSSKSPKKEMPRAIREAPEEMVRAYLSAVFDNDGYIGEKSIELAISSGKLASQVHTMLLNFGIISSLAPKKVKNYADNEYFRVTIYGENAQKFIKKIGFIRKEKRDRAKKYFKLSPNPNRDLIPNVASLLKKIKQKYLDRFARLTNKGWIYQAGILVPKYAFNSLRSYNSGARMPGYQGLGKILDFYQPISQEPEYHELEKISKRNFYWDKIKNIEMTCGEGYDFFVPGSDSFIGNGFVNHNTIFLNTLVLSLLYRCTPDNLRLIMVDPKRVEFQHYNDIPHLLCPVIYDATKTINALQWLTREMERRFEVFSEVPAKNLATYNQNKTVIASRMQLPYIVFVVDELADLMAAKGREIEAGVVRLAQMARATGIHLVLATQRPSVEVITGLIKANVPTRITFQVASQIDSRTVIDTAGAEKLLGAGDMLFLSAKSAKIGRIQGPYISEKEVKRVVDFIIEQKEKIQEPQSVLVQNLHDALAHQDAKESGGGEEFFGGDDPLFEDVKKIVLETQKASASFLQRRLRIGYSRAARLIDMLEEKGIVGPADGAKPREVYANKTDFISGISGSRPDESEDASDDGKWQKV